MEAQYFLAPSLTLAWIFLFFFPSVCTGMNGLEIKLTSTVFVAFSGGNLSINFTLHNLSNQTSEVLQCFDSSLKEIFISEIKPIEEGEVKLLELKNLNSSGLYKCTCNTAEVKWFLRVTDKGQKIPSMWEHTEIIIMACFTGVLLVFSVLGSVYVFRGHWTETRSKSLGRKQKQNSEDRKETEKEEDNMDMTSAQSSSFYASLEPRPRSIYDVLDCSAANSNEQQTKPESPKKELSKVPPQEEQNGEHQDEGIFESVYENF